MIQTVAKLPPLTIVIEWENAIDVRDEWTERAMRALQDELEREHERMSRRPRVTYLYDRNAVSAGTVEAALAGTAPRLGDFADVEIVPTDGLSYYKLKNFGIARAETGISIMLDSDAAPQPGWLAGLVAPFEDPEMVAVGGFTVLGHNDLLSKTMALSWIFNLKEERAKTVKRHKIHANNCAVRTDFFRAHPFPDLPAFKKQCGFWLRDLEQQGFRYVRTASAMTVHAPHPGYRFLAWRAWTTGTDRDYQAFQTISRSRLSRTLYSFEFFGSKVGRAWYRIAAKGRLVDLPLWQRPLAMAIAFGFYLVALLGELSSALTRDFDPLPEPRAARPSGAGA